MKKDIQSKVSGMTCGNCALSINHYLTQEGAENIVVNPSTGEVNFTINEEKSEEDIFDGIERLGYKVLRDENHEHTHDSQTKAFLIISFILWLPLMLHMFVKWHFLHNPITQLILTTPIYIISIIYFGKSALRSLKNGIPNMDVLVFASSTAAYFYSIIGWVLYPEAVHNYLFFETTASIVTLVLAGNFLEEYTVTSTASSVKELMKYQKTTAKLVLKDSIGKETIIEVNNDELKLDDEIQVNTGDKIPTDGIIISGTASVNESMMTGESIPVLKTIKENVLGGTIIESGNIRMKATAIGSQTALANIIKLVNQAQAAKSPMQKLADKISAIFVPIVVSVAVLTFLVNYYGFDISFANSMMRSIAVMVIACPCAMGLATPAAVMVGLGRAAQNGILIKGGDSLESMKKIKYIVFDKTGTLTSGKLIIDKFSTKINEDEFKKVVVSLEHHSSHPIAKSILDEWGQIDYMTFDKIEEIKGIGITAFDSHQNNWKIGSYRLLQNSEQPLHDLYLLKNDEIVGWIDFKDEIRPEAKQAVIDLHKQGFKTVLLSGDRKEKCDIVAKELNIDKVYSQQLPEDKLNKLTELMKNGVTTMVGDGINDAPALTKADIGISLSDSSHIAMQSADVVLLKSNLSRLSEAISLGKHTYQTIVQNLFWAFSYNIVAIPVAAVGLLSPTWGAGIMALSDVVLIINSIRLRYKKLN